MLETLFWTPLKGTRSMNDCRLCSDLGNPNETWNAPLFESSNFVGLPSLGALVEGWLLLIPKEHFLCMGALPDFLAPEMQDLKQKMCLALERRYGSVCVFEHGPSKTSTSVGCGVDHAHLHVAPINFDLHASVTPFLPRDVIWSDAGLEQCVAAFCQGRDYLYLEQPIGRGRIATHGSFGSQLFRRAIAAQIGERDYYNWREYPRLSNVEATIRNVASQRDDSVGVQAGVAA
jgi:diadenosine tetraphosphate (Ap4A) HIT family hydrolase